MRSAREHVLRCCTPSLEYNRIPYIRVTKLQCATLLYDIIEHETAVVTTETFYSMYYAVLYCTELYNHTPAEKKEVV